MAKDKNYMTEEERYLDILNTYGISSDKTLEEIHAILRDKKSKHHPDKGGDIKIFQEINNDDTYIVQTLMKKYGRTYVYPVNNTRTGGSTSGNTSSNNGYNTSPNGNNNFGNNNNNKTDESLRKEKQDFYNYVMFVKKVIVIFLK